MGNGSFLSETSVSPVVEKKSTERLYLHDHAGNDDLGRCVTRGVRPVPKAGDDSVCAVQCLKGRVSAEIFAEC